MKIYTEYRKAKIIDFCTIQIEGTKEIIEVEAGNGAVKVRINGEQKIQKVTLNDDLIADADLRKVEKWLESAITQAINRSQQVAAEKMKSMAGGLGLPGL
jgi:DNA-binding protein YbaB